MVVNVPEGMRRGGGGFPRQVPQQVPGTPRAADPTQSVLCCLWMKTGNQEAGTKESCFAAT